MIRATKGTSRRPNHMPSHLDALLTPAPVNLRRLPRGFHSVAKQASFETLYIRVQLGFGEVLGGQNGAPNRVFACFFAMFFSSAFRHRFGLHFWRLRTSKNRFSPERGANFHKIGVFEKPFKKAPFWLRLGRPKPSKIDDKSCSKLSLFLTSFFLRFFLFFKDFGSVWGGPAPPKSTKNRSRGPKNGFRDAFWTRLSLKMGLGRVLGRFGEGLGRILNGFLMEFCKDFDKIFDGSMWDKL